MTRDEIVERFTSFANRLNLPVPNFVFHDQPKADDERATANAKPVGNPPTLEYWPPFFEMPEHLQERVLRFHTERFLNLVAGN